jgi:hypothetical protein
MKVLTITEETLDQYFQRPESPRKNSPVGKLIVCILENDRHMKFEDARAEANRLLAIAAKARIYRFPRVRSDAQKAARSISLAKLASARESVPVGAQ